MARLADLSLAHRLFVSAYRFERYATPTASAPPLLHDLSTATVALVTTGGLHLPEDVPFDRELRGGDVSFREIPNDVDPTTLRCSHRSDAFDGSGIEADPELAFPHTVLANLVRDQTVRRASPIHLSFMGSITKPERLIAETAPAAAARLAALDVDAVLLVPV